MNPLEELERSIIKTYRREIWRNFAFAVGRYKLIQEGDRIAACISGGKDSMLMAKCLQEMQRHGPVGFWLEFLVMDPGYSKENRNIIEKNAERLGLPVHIADSDIYEIVSKTEQSPCYLCARMRRGCLYRHAEELGCNKIALGHHFDDVVETILLSMFYGGQVRTMMPKLHSTNYPKMELIRPMYLIKEADIIRWQKHNSLEFIKCACRFSEGEESSCSDKTGKRAQMKALLTQLRRLDPKIEQNIFASVENINLETIISYKKGNRCISFLDEYDL